jgi:phosphoenolpyruvate phosphomutase
MTMHNASKLKTLFQRRGIIKVAGAHDALSAKLIEQAGFDAVWASGFGISATLKCIPDASFITLSEQVGVERNMADAITIPIIADCDTGYGNALNVMRTVNDHERAGIAAICLEDNVFPKRCSFYAGVRRELISIEEHCGKIKAAKAAQEISDFMVIARTEALIAGWGKEEALKRIHAYAEAGADAILIHSKSPTFDELRDVAQACQGLIPLVAVPTIYGDVTTKELEEAGFKVAIFANQALRSAIRAMRDTLRQLIDKGMPHAVKDEIVALDEVYELVGVPKMKEDERRFLTPDGERITTIIAAAGFEKSLLPLIQDKPKCLLDVKGKTILERQVGTLNECNIKEIALIRGYKKEAIMLPNIRYYDNDRYEETGDLFTFFCAKNEMKGRCLLLYGDIIFDTPLLQKLLKSPADISLVVDMAWHDHQKHFPDLKLQPNLVQLKTSPGTSYRYVDQGEGNQITKIGRNLSHEEVHGEFIGIAMFSEQGIKTFKESYKDVNQNTQSKGFHESGLLAQASLTDLIQELIDLGHDVQCVPTYKGWMEVDSFEDYQRAWAETPR